MKSHDTVSPATKSGEKAGCEMAHKPLTKKESYQSSHGSSTTTSTDHLFGSDNTYEMPLTVLRALQKSNSSLYATVLELFGGAAIQEMFAEEEYEEPLDKDCYLAPKDLSIDKDVWETNEKAARVDHSPVDYLPSGFDEKTKPSLANKLTRSFSGKFGQNCKEDATDHRDVAASNPYLYNSRQLGHVNSPISPVYTRTKRWSIPEFVFQGNGHFNLNGEKEYEMDGKVYDNDLKMFGCSSKSWSWTAATHGGEREPPNKEPVYENDGIRGSTSRDNAGEPGGFNAVDNDTKTYATPRKAASEHFNCQKFFDNGEPSYVNAEEERGINLDKRKSLSTFVYMS